MAPVALVTYDSKMTPQSLIGAPPNLALVRFQFVKLYTDSALVFGMVVDDNDFATGPVCRGDISK